MDDLKASKAAVDKEILQEKKANIEVKEKITSLEDQIDTLKARVKMLEDNLATEQAELAQKVDDAEDKFKTYPSWRVNWTKPWLFGRRVSQRKKNL